jgi:hypothetical protein
MDDLTIVLKLTDKTEQCWVDSCTEMATINVGATEGSEYDEMPSCGPHVIAVICGGVVDYVMEAAQR